MEEYLGHLRAALGPISEQEARDIVEEIRSHIRETSQRGGALEVEAVRATLGRLGSAVDLAALYRVENLAQRTRRTGSLWLAWRTILRWAGLSLEGIRVLFVSVTGYFLAIAFVICGVAKPFNPERVGLWRLADPDGSWSLHLGFGNAPQGREVLGWWIVPLGILLGTGLALLTSHYGMRRIASFRRRLPLGPEGIHPGGEE